MVKYALCVLLFCKIFKPVNIFQHELIIDIIRLSRAVLCVKI